MRIWHEDLIPKLCQKHLCAMWREGLGMLSILTENKQGYRNHPATKEFEGRPWALWVRLRKVREEMVKRGYKPKSLPLINGMSGPSNQLWQTLEEQIEVLKSKKCRCNV